MATTGRTSFLPPALDPASGWDITMRGVVGGDPRFFDYGRFGILNDNSVMRARVEGAATGAPNSTWATGGSSGSFRTSWGGGGESDPGGYNYKTLANTSGTTAQLLGTAANFAMDRMSGSDPDTSFRFGNTPIYQKYRGKQQALARQERIQNRQTARQQQQQAAAKQQQMANFAGQTFATSMGLAAGAQAGNKPPKAGASSPMPRGGTPPPGPINLLTGPTALGQPPKKPRAARSTVPKPKATRPVPAATLNDPSNW